MIKISKNLKDEYADGKISELFDEIDSVLQKRASIQERYLRGITSTEMGSDAGVQVFFEKFITDLAAGYLSGEITYNAEIVDQSEEPAYRLLHPSHTQPLDPDTAAQLKFIITTLSSKNDDPRVLKALFHDAVLYGAAYERELDLVNNNPDETETKNINQMWINIRCFHISDVPVGVWVFTVAVILLIVAACIHHRRNQMWR